LMSVRRHTAVIMMVLATLIASLVPAAPATGADSQSFTLSPGQTEYVSFGTCGMNELVYWVLSFSPSSTAFTDWLQKPDGTQVGLEFNNWGMFTDQEGEWKLGFSLNASGSLNVTVTYDVYHVVPSLVVNTPVNSSYTNAATLTVSGTCDEFTSSVLVSLDNVHWAVPEFDSTDWTCQVHLAPGLNTIYAEWTYFWGTYTNPSPRVSFTADPITVTLDASLPTVSVTEPQSMAQIRGDYVDFAWQSSDNIGIASTEINIDRTGWMSVTGLEAKHLWVGSGDHIFQIKVTDLAGNQAGSYVEFNNDNRTFSIWGPNYGLPLVAITVGVILAGLIIALTVVKKRLAPPAPPSQPPSAPPIDR